MPRNVIRKKLPWRFFLVPLLCLSMTISAQAGTVGKIAGNVKDAQTGESLPGVNIVIQDSKMGAATDPSGDYFILNVPPGIYNVEASMVGYTTLSKAQIEVNIDRTVRVDFSLSPTTIQGEEVTVVAEREVVHMDMSASQVAISQQQVYEVPLVVSMPQMINLQAGVENMIIRGGGLDQTGMVVDGLRMDDNESNEPMLMVNLSAMQEVNIIKGGFNAEYGNIRSGLINVVTKEGSWSRYNGSLDFRYGVAHQKHRGASLFSWDNYYLRPYLDPAVCWVGTENGSWDEYTKKQYQSFAGWNSFVADNPGLGLTPEEARDLFIWQHRADGSADLGHPHPGKYGDEPDYNLDVSFGGPIPFVGQYLGNMSFFFSHYINVEWPVLPSAIDNLFERNTLFKLTSNLSNSMKLGVEGVLGKLSLPGEGDPGAGTGAAGELPDGYDRGIYFIHGSSPLDIKRYMVGVTFDHVLSPMTFYNVRLSIVNKKNDMNGARVLRDLTIRRTFGNTGMDERPWGWLNQAGYQYALGTDHIIGGVGGGGKNFNEVNTINGNIDFTSQVTKRNQVQAGIMLIYDDYNITYGEKGLDPTGDEWIEWKQSPLRIGAYVQDKLEFEGMIANLGLRMDYNDPNTSWYTVDPYSKYFSRQYKDQFLAETPSEPAKGKMKISPRLGVSHPITAVSKLYFNYGHFYSMPLSSTYYEINYGRTSTGILSIGNPNQDLPRTIAYELGYEHELGKGFLITLAGYYKDISNQTASRSYINYDGSVNYNTYDNSNYEDIRGFELTFERRWGKWVTGWMNYNYQVITSGFFGREIYYQDPRQQAIYGLRNPVQEKPLPQPFARANLRIMSPSEWGPQFVGVHWLDELSLDFLFQYKSGEYFTWEPVPPYTEENNVQWKSYYNFDLRINKRFRVSRYNMSLFADITNLFDIKYLRPFAGFSDEGDMRDYYNSLHLPIYSQEKYKTQGYTAGNDKPGDVRSSDKPYINMPNIDFISWNPPRSVLFGLIFDF
jgi:CarboxypepD_reg-like domain/TonB-dependent Receptor Plug Domain